MAAKRFVTPAPWFINFDPNISDRLCVSVAIKKKTIFVVISEF
jgi:hypothetical protein